MRAFTQVVLNRHELSLLKTASLHLGVAYPLARTSMPRQVEDRHPDHEARVVLALLRDPTLGTHENIQRGLAVLEKLAGVLDQQRHLRYWLDDAEQTTGTRPEPSDDPTSGYRNLAMLAEIRAGQLRDVNKALGVLRKAAPLTTPRPDVDDEYDEYDEG